MSKKLDDLVRVQCADGNWNANPYMHGMANGMILAQSVVNGTDPTFLVAPEKWRDTSETALLSEDGSP